ncbi:TBC1 domain family member 24-like [Varroa destructor]|uniref:TLDc domain-containing protein n=1 Tax=Varroa destructor TaxID=109461 RepID=A0A7M7MFB0_VARDE|nr:TBC1 domain family member 24-like [Varroa destructor]
MTESKSPVRRFVRSTISVIINTFSACIPPPRRRRRPSSDDGSDHEVNIDLLQDIESSVVNPGQLRALWDHLPLSCQARNPKMVYNSQRDGTSLQTFFNKVEGHEHTLVLIRSKRDEAFGAFCSGDWEQRKSARGRSFGKGETFVFKFGQDDTNEDELRVFHWVGLGLPNRKAKGDIFLSIIRNMVAIGGNALVFGGENGTTEKSRTFNNEPLTENGEFEIAVLEVIVFPPEGYFEWSATATPISTIIEKGVANRRISYRHWGPNF